MDETKSSTTPKPTGLRVYLSYPGEVKDVARKLYSRLKQDGFEPWLFDIDMPGGVDWRKESKEALRNSDVFVFCISHYSTERERFFLKELEYAQEFYEEVGKERFQILPLRVEDCQIPDSLSRLMTFDLHVKGGYERLVSNLRNRAALTTSVVFLLHGIKTRGKWQKDVVPLLSMAGFKPAVLDYGYFLALQLLRKGSREKKTDWFRDEYITQCGRLHCDRPSIVAHSFGAYLVAAAMQKYPQIKFDRIILCGAIVHRKFPWKEFATRGQLRFVLNQYGGRDLWARVVAWAVEDAGQSGLRGFLDENEFLIQQKHPRFRHSDYFYELNYKDNWIPFLKGQPLDLRPIDERRFMNWRFWIVRVLLILLFAAIVYYSFRWWKEPWLPTQIQTIGKER